MHCLHVMTTRLMLHVRSVQIEEHSADGETLQGFPYNQMHHYVNKITACYQTYQRLYAGQ